MKFPFLLSIVLSFGLRAQSAETVPPRSDTPSPVANPARNRKAYFRPDFEQFKEGRLDGEVYAIINHAEAGFDPDGRLTKAGVREFLSIVKKHGVPTLGSIGSIENEQFFSQSEVDSVLRTFSGAHRLRFTNAKTLLFAGGNFQYCLCEFIRDAIRFRDSKDPLTLVLATDAIYDLPGDLKDPNFRRDNPFQLASRLRELSAKERFVYLRDSLVAHGDFCGNYRDQMNGKISAKDFKFRIEEFNGRTRLLIGKQFGSGSREISVILTENEKLPDLLETIQTPQRHNGKSISQ